MSTILGSVMKTTTTIVTIIQRYRLNV